AGNVGEVGGGKRYLRDFVVQASGREIQVKSEADPSSTSPYRTALLNAIWVFDAGVDLEQVKAGALNDRALFYVRCGEEPIEERACVVALDYAGSGANATGCCIQLPYDLRVQDYERNAAWRGRSATTSVKQRWEPLLAGGAQFVTGDERLDRLYKTSLINIFLLRTRYPGAANGSEDLYVVKPGATTYNAFWYRDAAYLTAALGVA